MLGIGSQELGSWIFGGTTLIFLLLSFCFGPEKLPQWKERLLAIVSALSAGLFAFFFTGTVTVRVEPDITLWGKIVIQAGGAFALFVVVLLWWERHFGTGGANEGGQYLSEEPRDAGDLPENLIDKYGKSMRELGYAEAEIERLKRELANAIERAKRVEQRGDIAEARGTIEELRKTKDVSRLLGILTKDREIQGDVSIQRNREIAAVAILKGDRKRAVKGVFVGRKAGLDMFRRELEDPKGKVVLVVGQAGMGKTWLLNKMTEMAENLPSLKCGCVRYEVTSTDSVDSTMALMMDNAFDAAQLEEGSFVGTKRRLEQWRALLNVINIGDLVMSLRRSPAKNTREQFLERLRLISKRMPENGRAIFIIDPEKYMQKDSDQSWAIVLKEIPEKIKFVFAQRPEDALVGSDAFDELDNVVRIPEKRLDVLSDEDIDNLVKSHSTDFKCNVYDLKKAVRRYEGHPYAIGAAIDLAEAGVRLEYLPRRPEPTEFAKVQWQKIYDKGNEAIRLFKAYAVLEVGVPGDVVREAGNLDTDTFQRILADKYCSGLLREEREGRRIYHAILADYILGQMGEAEKKEYHGRAVEVYRGKLAKAEKEQIRPDSLSAMRLAEHVLAAEGKEAFVDAFVDECGEALMNLGLLDTFISLSERALEIVEKGSKKEAMVTGNLGVIYQRRGELDRAEEALLKILEIHEKLGDEGEKAKDYINLGLVYFNKGELDKAEKMFLDGLEINEKIGSLEVMVAVYGNLGHIYGARGELDKAEEMHIKALGIDKKIGRLEGMARQYGNLGNVYNERSELDKAEEMYLKSLEISEPRGMLELTANQYSNLGTVYYTKGELDKSEQMFQKSLEMAEKLGLQVLIASEHGNLGSIYLKRGELDKAEEMHRMALEIDKKIGRLEGMAIDYANLGSVYKQRGNIAKAGEYWEKAVGLYKKIGMPHMVEKVEGWIERISDK